MTTTRYVIQSLIRTIPLWALAPISPILLAEEPIGRVLNDFEAVQPSWQIVKRDSLLRIVGQRRTDRISVRGRRCEFLSVVGSRGGEQILAVHEIPAFAAINEFRANLWVRGDRAGFQLMVRARLPRTLDGDGQPTSMLLLGDQYHSPGHWQQLSVDGIEAKIADQTRVLRLRRGHDVDSTNAYIDSVVLNIYGGAGINRIWVDDLTVNAAVSQPRPDRDQHVRLASHRTTTPQRSISSRNGKIIVDDQPFAVRAVSHQGESFRTLRELGFNTVWLEQPPTQDQLTEARLQKLSLISPPPEVDGNFAQYDPVIAWCIGQNLRASDTGESRRVGDRVWSLDPLRRPRLVTTQTDGRWPGLADIVVDVGTSLTDDNGNQSTWRFLGSSPSASIRWMSLRADIHRALARGCQNFVLLTDKNLETPASRHARCLAELFNTELRIVQPWIGQLTQGGTTSSWLDVTLYENYHSSFVIVRRAETGAGGGNLQPVHVEIPDSNNREVFLYEPGGLSAASYRRVPGGVQVQLEPGARHVNLLLTNRPTVIQECTHFLRDIGPRSKKLLLETARAELLELDRQIERSTDRPSAKAQLRGELHTLQSNIATWMESPGQETVMYRQLEHVLSELESLHRRVGR